jgi:hypothetical protein
MNGYGCGLAIMRILAAVMTVIIQLVHARICAANYM